jgi:hypothetical protein
MGLRFRVGAGPLSYSTRIGGGRKAGPLWTVAGAVILFVLPLALWGGWGWLIDGPVLVLLMLRGIPAG